MAFFRTLLVTLAFVAPAQGFVPRSSPLARHVDARRASGAAASWAVSGMRRRADAAAPFSSPLATTIMMAEGGRDGQRTEASRTMTAGGFGTGGEAPFELRGFSLGDAALAIGGFVTVSSFAQYFNNVGGLSGLGFVYGLPIMLIGASLKCEVHAPPPPPPRRRAWFARIARLSCAVSRHWTCRLCSGVRGWNISERGGAPTRVVLCSASSFELSSVQFFCSVGGAVRRGRGGVPSRSACSVLVARYAELAPVPVQTTEANKALFELKATETIKSIDKDVTRHRYGDEAHLDTTVKRLGLVLPQREYPQLSYLKYDNTPAGELEVSVWARR